MTLENVLLMAGAATTVWLIWREYLGTDASATTSTKIPDSATTSTGLPDSVGSVCPTGSVAVFDGSCCASANVQPDGSCGSCAVGTSAAADASGNPVCCPTANLDTSGICQVCPIGYSPNSDGSACVNPSGDAVPGFGLNFTTGNKWADMAVNMGITVATNLGLEEAGKALKKAVTKPTTVEPLEPTVEPVEPVEPPTVEPVEPPAVEPVEPPTVEPLEAVEPPAVEPAVEPVEPVEPPALNPLNP